MNILHMVSRALVFAGMAVIAGCSMDATEGGADDALAPIGEASQAIAGVPLTYGQTYTLQNGHDHFTGGYLETRGFDSSTGNLLNVSTSTTTNRDGGSATWKLLPATGTGKGIGEYVSDGDKVYLQNMHANDGGYLDVRGGGCQNNDLCVSTAVGSNRENGSGTWQIQFQNEAEHSDSQVREGDIVVFKNGYGNFGVFNAGWLDTRGLGCNGDLQCVSTSFTQERDTDSTHWKLIVAGPY